MKSHGRIIQSKPFVTTKIEDDAPIVLYVEDNSANRAAVRISLGRKVNLLLASNDRNACEFLTQKGKSIAIILMDIELQNSYFNGIELTRLIRGKSTRRLPDYAQQIPVLDVPIVFLTAYGTPQNKELIIEAGGNDVLEKPVDFPSLKWVMNKFNMKL